MCNRKQKNARNLERNMQLNIVQKLTVKEMQREKIEEHACDIFLMHLILVKWQNA